MLFDMQILRYFCSSPPLFGAPFVGALGSCASRLPLDLPLHVDQCKCCQLRWTLSVIN